MSMVAGALLRCSYLSGKTSADVALTASLDTRGAGTCTIEFCAGRAVVDWCWCRYATSHIAMSSLGLGWPFRAHGHEMDTEKWCQSLACAYAAATSWQMHCKCKECGLLPALRLQCGWLGLSEVRTTHHLRLVAAVVGMCSSRHEARDEADAVPLAGVCCIHLRA